MEHSSTTAFVTSSHNSPNKLRAAFHPFKSKPFDQRERKKLMEEIQTLQTKIVEYLQHLSSQNSEIIAKALENLSLNESVLKINLIQLPKSATKSEIKGQINFLEKTLLKLNSIAKQAKKVGRYRASLIQKKFPRESKVLQAHNDSKEKQQHRSISNPRTIQQRSFNHIKLLYHQELQLQLKRRYKQQAIQIRQQKTQEIIRENNLKKEAEKKKKDKELKEKRRVFYEALNSKQAKQLERVEKKMEIIQTSVEENRSKLFTKIFNFHKNVEDNKRIIEEDEKRRLQYLEISLDQRQKTTYFNRITERANKTAKASKDNSIQMVMKRKLRNEKEREDRLLSALLTKMKFNELPQNSSAIKIQAKHSRSPSHQTQFTVSLPSVVPHPSVAQPRAKSNKIAKKAQMLKELSQNLNYRNQQIKQTVEKNRSERMREEAERIETLNSIYHTDKIKTNLAHQQKRKKENKHIFDNFKTRCKQDALHSQLSEMLMEPNTHQLESTLNYMNSGRCKMFQSKQ